MSVIVTEAFKKICREKTVEEINKKRIENNEPILSTEEYRIFLQKALSNHVIIS
jgi:hypothetical protein